MISIQLLFNDFLHLINILICSRN